MKKLLLALALLLVALPASAQQTTQTYVTSVRPGALQVLQASGAGTTWAPVTMGGDLSANTSPGLFFVTGLTGNGGTIAAKSNFLQWSSALTPTVSQAALATANGTGATMTLQAQNETGTGATVGGGLNLTSGSGATPGTLNLQVGGVTVASGTVGTFNIVGSTLNLAGATSLNLAGSFFGSFTASAGFLANGTGNGTLFGGTYNGSGGLIHSVAAEDASGNVYIDSDSVFTAASAAPILYLTTNAGTIQTNSPVEGNVRAASPYGAHGDVTGAYTSGGALSAAAYAMDFFLVSPTAAMTLTFPRAALAAGFSKKFQVTAAFAVTISDGTHSVVLPAAVGLYLVEFTNAALYFK